jgi:pimeloyl-ACP methyl ester carboxylesterase
VDHDFRPRREGSARVAGGRVIGFAEWGSPDSRPVVAFHGDPGSRLMAVGCEERADELGLRIICLERPGFGLSEFASDRTLVAWADDVAAATSALNLDRFVVVGVSAGAPYALACGARLPSRIEAVGVIAGIAPPQFLVDDELAELIERDRHEAEEAARRHFSAMRTDIDASVRAMATRDGPDGNTYARPDVQERFAMTRREAFRQGVDGAVLDLILLHQPWGFELEDIAVTTHWWHGSLDPIAPLATVREATTRTEIQLTIYEDEGHAVSFEHGAEILAELAATSEGS